MGIDTLFDVSGSGLKAQMMRMEVLSANMANVNVTRTPEGGPYRRKDVIFQSVPVASSFENELQASTAAVSKVEVSRVVEDNSPFLRKYNPQHPDAGADGFVSFPNVNIVAEMVDLQEASRSYEANLSVVMAVKNMIAKTFEIGK